MSMTQHLAFTARIADLAGLVVLVSPVAGHAQISPFLTRQGSAADFDLADATARKPLDPQPAPFGTNAAWLRIDGAGQRFGGFAELITSGKWSVQAMNCFMRSGWMAVIYFPASPT